MTETIIPDDIDLTELISKFDLFSDLSPASVEAIAMATADMRYCEGDTILATGQDDGATVYAIVEGTVRRSRGLAAIGDIDVDLWEAGALFDVTALALGEEQPDPSLGLVAQSDVRVLAIDAPSLSTLLEQQPAFQHALLRQLARDVRRLSRTPEAAADPLRRIYQHLVSLMTAESSQYVIDPMPRHKALAEAAGVSERAAAEAIGILVRERVLSRQFPIAIVEDADRLRSYAR